MLVDKPGYEYRVGHTHAVPDVCTIFHFKYEFYKSILQHCQVKNSWFFNNPDLQSVLLKTSPETEYLHYAILHQTNQQDKSRLLIDSMVLDLIGHAMKILTDNPNPIVPEFTSRCKNNYLTVIEKAKDFITTNFTDDISLFKISNACNISPFHFSRIFKIFTSYSPYQYLLTLRLKQCRNIVQDHISSCDRHLFFIRFQQHRTFCYFVQS